MFSCPSRLVLLRNKTTWFRPFCVQYFSTKAQTAVQRIDYHSNTVNDKQPIKIILLLGTHHNGQSESRLLKVFFGGKRKDLWQQRCEMISASENCEYSLLFWLLFRHKVRQKGFSRRCRRQRVFLVIIIIYCIFCVILPGYLHFTVVETFLQQRQWGCWQLFKVKLSVENSRG